MSGNPILRDLKKRVARRMAIWPLVVEKRLVAIDEVANDFAYIWRQVVTDHATDEEQHAYKVLRRWLRIYAKARL